MVDSDEGSGGPPPPPPREGSQGAGEELQGLPRRVRFDGILEGPCGSSNTMRVAVRALEQCAVVGVELEIDGGHFSVLLDDATLDGQSFGPGRREDFAAALQGVIEASNRPADVDSTLRCVAVYESEVVETLFAVSQGQLRPVSRARAVQPDDQSASSTPTHAALPTFKRNQALMLGALLVLLGGALSWRHGYVDRILAATAEEMEADTGPFGQMLELEFESSWGDYDVVLSRGEGYPDTVEAVTALEGEALTTADRAAVRAVADGAAIYVRLEDQDGKVLAVQRVELRSLLTNAGATEEFKLPGKAMAWRVSLALDEGMDP